MFLPFLNGFSISGSLIIAIGAQNAFVIRQGLRREHLLLTALMCSCLDSLLILSGILGFGNFLSFYPSLVEWTKYFAVVFLFSYGLLSFRSAFTKKRIPSSSLEEKSVASVKKTVWSLLALSLLNPHAYLDTVILLGSVASQHPSHEQTYFAAGAILASFTWFFVITYGAFLLAPVFKQEKAWRWIDGIVGATMWGIAFAVLRLMK